MANFSLGSNGTGRLEAWENWNSSSQVSMHYKLWVTVTGSAYHGGPGPSWSGSIGGGHVGSGGWSYPGSGTRNYVLREFDVTFNKDANGYINIGIVGNINGDNAPYVGSNGTSWTHSPARIGEAPGGRARSVDTITDTSARLGAKHDNNGRGTSSANRNYYRLDNTGSWSQTADNSGTGWKYRTVTLLSNRMYGYFSRHWNNNGDTADTSTATFVTLANASESAKDILATTVAFSLNVSQGYYTTTAKVQYRKKGDTTWLDSGTGSGATPTINVAGLLPNTIYEYRLVVTTTAGTWEGSVQELTTLPAGKLVMPDGSVKNAITRLVFPDGTPTVMANINLIREE